VRAQRIPAAALASALAAALQLAPAAAAAQTPNRTVPTEAAPSAGATGTLSQNEVAIRLESPQVEVRFLPLEEDLLRVLAPDAAASLRGLVRARRVAIDSVGRAHGVARPGIALVSFRGLQDGARFAPDLVIVVARGRVSRPLGIVPLTASFSTQQLDARATASGLYLFEEPLPVTEPLTVGYEGVQSDEWRERLPMIDRARGRVLGRPEP
jgi:hypothetical protein